MRISGALAKARPLRVQFEDDYLNLTYRPASYTVRQLQEIQDEESKRTDPARVVEMIQKMVVDWDLTEDDGVKVDLANTERLKDIPTPIFMAILREAREDQSVGEAPRPSAAS
jgi:hypothetical protein